MILELTDNTGKAFELDDNSIKVFTPYPDGCFIETTKGNFSIRNRMLDPHNFKITRQHSITYPSIEKLRDDKRD